MAFKDVLVWCSWWIWDDKGPNIFQHGTYKKTWARAPDKAIWHSPPQDDSGSKCYCSHKKPDSTSCLSTICEEKGQRPGFCHSPGALSCRPSGSCLQQSARNHSCPEACAGFPWGMCFGMHRCFCGQPKWPDRATVGTSGRMWHVVIFSPWISSFPVWMLCN